MSFWRTFGFHTVSAVETILDKESFTLEELLDEEEILQETKSQNKKLLDLYLKLIFPILLFVGETPYVCCYCDVNDIVNCYLQRSLKKRVNGERGALQVR